MSVKMRCHCGQELLTADTSIGQAVRCPQCTILLLVPDVRPDHLKRGVPPPVPGVNGGHVMEGPARKRARAAAEGPAGESVFDEDSYAEGDRPRQRKRKKKAGKYAGLAVVNVGLMLLLTGMLGSVGVFALSLLLIPVQFASPELAFVVSFPLLGISLLVPVAFLVGAILCCWAPAKSGVRPRMIAAIALNIAGPILFFAASMFAGALMARHTVGATEQELQIRVLVMGYGFFFLSIVLVAATHLTYIDALRRIAEYLDETEVAREGDQIFKMVVHSALAISVSLPFSIVPVCLSAIVCLSLFVGGAIYWIVASVKMIFFLNNVRALVSRYV